MARAGRRYLNPTFLGRAPIVATGSIALGVAVETSSGFGMDSDLSRVNENAVNVYADAAAARARLLLKAPPKTLILESPGANLGGAYVAYASETDTGLGLVGLTPPTKIKKFGLVQEWTFDTGVDSVSAVSGCIVASSASLPRTGAASLRIQSTVVGDLTLQSATFAVTVGDMITVSAWKAGFVSTHAVDLSIQFYDAGGFALSSEVASSTSAAGGTYTQLAVGAEVPASAVTARWIYVINDTTVGVVHFVDDVDVSTLPYETDISESPLTATSVSEVALGLATVEVDTGIALSSTTGTVLGFPTETDSSFAVGAQTRTFTFGIAEETDIGFPVEGETVPTTLGLATSTETGLPVTVEYQYRTFTCPSRLELPPYLPGSNGMQKRLYRHYRARPAGINVFVYREGTVSENVFGRITEIPPASTYDAAGVLSSDGWEDIEIVYWGGHGPVNVTADQAAVLEGAGYFVD
jgi:hypothetical protein